LWQERYPGGLSETEESFADAMTSLATRRRRRRRLAAAAIFAVLLVVLAVVGTLWQRSLSEARRAEAAKLIALGEVELETFPTASLAWAVASIQLADTLEGRLLGLRALSQGPPVTVCPVDGGGGYSVLPGGMTMSRSGRFLVSGFSRLEARHHEGGEPTPIEHPGNDGWMQMGFAPDEILITGIDGTHRWWSVPEVERPTRVLEDRGWLVKVLDEDYLGFSFAEERLVITRWPFDGGPGRVVGEVEPWHEDAFDEVELILASAVDESGSMLAYAPGNTVFLRSLDDRERPSRPVGRHEHRISRLRFDPKGEQLATVDQSGEIRIWSTASTSSVPLRTFNLGGVPTGQLAFDRSGRWLAGHGVNRGVRLFDLAAPRGTTALTLRRTDGGSPNEIRFHPSGAWLVTGYRSLDFWPLSHAYTLVLEHGGARVMDLAFTPDGGWLVTETPYELGGEGNGRVRAWPLEGQNDNEPRVLLEAPRAALIGNLDISPSGELVALSIDDGTVHLLPLEGGNPRRFPGRGPDTTNHLVAFSPNGRLLAHVPRNAPRDFMVIRIWDLESGEGRDLGAVGGYSVYLDFVDDHRIRWAGNSREGEGGGERIFDLENGSVEVVSQGGARLRRGVSHAGDFIVTMESVDGGRSVISWPDLQTGETRRIGTHRARPGVIALDPTNRWIVSAGGSDNNAVRVGPVSGEEPHLLLGHADGVTALAVSPEGRWIASGSQDGTVRLWPFPDMSKPPLHPLPHDELIAKLKTLTNLRVVRDETSATGWKLEVGPFPGWATVPEW
jgi:WD40 repeat protein